MRTSSRDGLRCSRKDVGCRVALVPFGFGLDPVSSPYFPISHMDVSFAITVLFSSDHLTADVK